MVVKITIRNLQSKVPVNSNKIVKAVQKVLSSEGIRKTGEITVSLVENREIKQLNLRYLGRNSPTDVIAFDVCRPQEKDKIFADIVVSTGMAIKNAKEFKTNPLFEVYLYVVHGVLHILGYEDKTQRQRAIMHEKARHILKLVIGRQ